jgi:uncharacterized protein (TIGR02466 family)
MLDLNHKLFPTLVKQKKQFISKEQSLDIFKYLMAKKELLKTHLAVTDGGSSHEAGVDTLGNISKEIETCKSLYSDVTIAAKNYAKEFGLDAKREGGITVSNSWFNIQNKNSRLNAHTHPGSAISGGLYINVDKNSSAISFFNPINLLRFTHISNITDYTCEWYKIHVEIGDLILFPSYLSHGSADDVNQTENRMIISFNSQ